MVACTGASLAMPSAVENPDIVRSRYTRMSSSKLAIISRASASVSLSCLMTIVLVFGAPGASAHARRKKATPVASVAPLASAMSVTSNLSRGRRISIPPKSVSTELVGV